MYSEYQNDPHDLLRPFLRVVVQVLARLPEGSGVGAPTGLEEATHKMWLQTIASALSFPDKPVDLQDLCAHIYPDCAGGLAAATPMLQHLESYLLSMPVLLRNRLFRYTLVCNSCGHEHNGCYVPLLGDSTEVYFVESAKRFCCSHCQGTTLTIRELPLLLLYYNECGCALQGIPPKYVELGPNYGLLSIVTTSLRSTTGFLNVTQWAVNEESRGPTDVLLQYHSQGKGMKRVPRKTALDFLSNPLSLKTGNVAYLFYVNLDRLEGISKTKYTAVLSSLQSNRFFEVQKTATLYGETSDSHNISSHSLFSRSLEGTPGYLQERSCESIQSGRSLSAFPPKGGARGQSLPPSAVTTLGFETITFEDLTRKVLALERTLNSYQVQQQKAQSTLQYTQQSSRKAAGRMLNLKCVEVELWLFVTLCVMGVLLLLSFILACVGINLPRVVTV